MKKEIKKCIKYYLDNINSDDYREYQKQEELRGNEVHKK
jgi:hypothetical protein